MPDYRSSDREAPFNMAIATLMRLDTILQQLRNLGIMYPNDVPEKQKAHIEFVRQFFINAVPLLENEDTESYKKEILGLGLNVRSGVKSGTQFSKFIYDKNIEKRLNEILIEIQQKVKKYFMPKGRDPRKAVERFE